MTKSFLEIAQEIADLCEQRFEPEDSPFEGYHCDGCGKEDNDECQGNYSTILASRLNRDVDLAIEAILRREFGDNNGPALERKVGSSTTDEAQIAKKFFRSSA